MLRVLVVEDEPVAAAAHAEYVRRVPGFDLAAVATTGQEALRVLKHQPVDLVLLDMNLPDLHGLDIVRSMRSAGHSTDVIAVTSARDLDVVRRSVSLGIVQYVLKPFVFSTLRERLESYARYRDQLAGDEVVASQQAVDRLLSQPRSGVTAGNPLPKGLSTESLEAVTRLLSEVRLRGGGADGGVAGDGPALPRVPVRGGPGSTAAAVLADRPADRGVRLDREPPVLTHEIVQISVTREKWPVWTIRVTVGKAAGWAAPVRWPGESGLSRCGRP